MLIKNKEGGWFMSGTESIIQIEGKFQCKFAGNCRVADICHITKFTMGYNKLTIISNTSQI
jgi:hypothetical protein